MNASTDRTPSKDNNTTHGRRTVNPTLGSITPPTGWIAVEAVVVDPIAGPLGSVIVQGQPADGAVNVKVTMVRVESSEAPEY
jgi:hypothetical protein